MSIEVKPNIMQQEIIAFAKELGVTPGQVEGVLHELGIAIESGKFEVDDDILGLIREELKGAKNSKTITLTSGVTPRDIASALGVPQPEVQKTLMMKLKQY